LLSSGFTAYGLAGECPHAQRNQWHLAISFLLIKKPT